jgi:type II secretory pathway pseudopilin PulG
MKSLKTTPKRPARKAFTLIEQLFALAMAGITVSAVVAGFWQATTHAEWSAYSLAAQSMALQSLEQTRAAKWDPQGDPLVDDLQATNFPTRIEVLDVPIGGGRILYATNRTTITDISAAPPLRMVQVECTWRFFNRGVFTNTVATYRAPDQ